MSRQTCACGRKLGHSNTTGLCHVCKRTDYHSEQFGCERQPPKAGHDLVCAECGAPFRHAQPETKVCGPACAQIRRDRQREQDRIRMARSRTLAEKPPKMGIHYTTVQHVETRTADLTQGTCPECKAYGLDVLGRQNHTRLCSHHPENRFAGPQLGLSQASTGTLGGAA